MVLELISGAGKSSKLVLPSFDAHFSCISRSVHNTRIERLWYDVTHGFGLKWKEFFLDLEVHHGLEVHNDSHIWLLHFLFLSAVNQDAQEWAAAWNSHHLTIRGERSRSPRDIFFFSMIQDGPRGIITQDGVPQPADEVDDLASYGIDWEVADDAVLMQHLLENNPQDWDDDNPFSLGPTKLSEVVCDPPNCPFSEEQVEYLGQELSGRVDIDSRNMQVRRLVWVDALALCTQLYNPI